MDNNTFNAASFSHFTAKNARKGTTPQRATIEISPSGAQLLAGAARVMEKHFEHLITEHRRMGLDETQLIQMSKTNDDLRKFFQSLDHAFDKETKVATEYMMDRHSNPHKY